MSGTDERQNGDTLKQVKIQGQGTRPSPALSYYNYQPSAAALRSL